MDNNNQMPNQMPSQMPPIQSTQTTEAPGVMNLGGMPEKKSGIGAIIATIIIIAIIILGGLYFWGKRIETEKATQALLQNSNNATEETAAVTEATKIETVSQDDSVNTISSELSTTNTDNLSSELE